jgi:hypothetical protein
MAKITVKIPHLVWRDGRPRFVPGPALRTMGYKGMDLKHPDGSWYSLEEASQWSDTLTTEITTRRQQKAIKPHARGGGGRGRSFSRRGYIAVGELLVKWLKERETEARQTGRPAKKTLKLYQYNIRAFEDFDPELWTAPAAAVTNVMANNIYKRLREQKGTAMSKAIISTIRPAWRWAWKEMGLVPFNPFTDLRMATPPPRLRVGTPQEMKHLIETADKEGRPDIGDAIMLGLCTGQRQNDRLMLRIDSWDETNWEEKAITFRQLKTGAIVTVPPIAPLIRRLRAARARRNRQGRIIPTVLFDERRMRRWPDDDGDAYRKTFRPLCDKAAETMPGLAGFRDQDLRDTAVTWLANAGCTLPQIASITGHSPDGIHKILKHYLATTPEQAAVATEKLGAWIIEQGGL